jgi:hypothetical protein
MTNVHPVHARATGLSGSFEVKMVDGLIDVSAPVSGRVELAVTQIRSSMPMFEKELVRRADGSRYPTLVGELHDIQTAGSPGRYRLAGKITFHGTTQEVGGEVGVTLALDGEIAVEGEQVFDIRDYGLDPPRLLLLRAEPEVRVRVRISARPET